MTEPEEFETHDIYLAAYLTLAGCVMKRERRVGQRKYFVFTNIATPISELRHGYYTGTATVKAHDFAQKIVGMKNLCFDPLRFLWIGSSMKWTIYCHTHVESGRHYIGLTKYTMMHRWNQHCAQAKSSKGGRWHFPNAIRKYGKDAFSHEVLEVCHSLEVTNLAEECWIELLETRDPLKGFNLAKGGASTPTSSDSIANMSLASKAKWADPEYRKRHAEALARPEAKLNRVAASKAKWADPETRERLHEASKKSHADPKYLAAASAASAASNARPEVRSAISSSLSGKSLKPSHRARISAVVKERLSSPEARASHLAMVAEVQSRPEWVERQSASHRGKVTSEETKARLSASNRSSDPEIRAKISASSKAYWERRRSA